MSTNEEKLKQWMGEYFGPNWTWEGVFRSLKSFEERDKFCGAIKRLTPKESDQGKNWHRTFAMISASEEIKMAAILVVFGVLRIDEVD